MMNRILVTGGSGFLGQRLLYLLSKKDVLIRSTYLNTIPTQKKNPSIDVEWRRYNVLDNSDVGDLLKDVDVVIHLAGMAHTKKNDEQTTIKFKEVNANGTELLARKAAINKVKQFIYISSIKVNGQSTSGINTPEIFRENDSINTTDPYAASKYSGECKLIDVCNNTNMKYTIFRPTLIFGPGVKANFLNLIKLVDVGVPLPFSKVDNCRSMIYVDNLCDAIYTSIKHDNAENKLFLIKDVDVSTAKLIRSLALVLNKSPRLFSFPVSILRKLCVLFGNEMLYEKLLGSLVVDDSLLRQELNWSPPIEFMEAIKETITWHKSNKGI